MSISLKSERELTTMRRAGRIVGNTLQHLRSEIRPGMTTRDVDRLADELIRQQGGIAAFPFINEFPGCACVSINHEVVHGIPGPRVIRDGDLVKIDIGAIFDGYHGDAAVTVAVGAVTRDARRLLEVTEQALAAGIAATRPGGYLNDIGAAIEDVVAPHGFGIVHQYVGHGVGRALHESPNVAHYRQDARGIALRPGMVLTIEPMINLGTGTTRVLPDGWTVVTADGRLSAQFEHTVAVTEAGPDVLTRPDHGEAWSIPLSETKRVHC